MNTRLTVMMAIIRLEMVEVQHEVLNLNGRALVGHFQVLIFELILEQMDS